MKPKQGSNVGRVMMGVVATILFGSLLVALSVMAGAADPVHGSYPITCQSDHATPGDALQGGLRYVKCGNDGAIECSATISANSAANPVFVRTTNGTNANSAAYPQYTVPVSLNYAGGTPTNCVALTNSSQQFSFVASTYYQVCVVGTTGYFLHGANPTATTTVGSGYDYPVFESTCTPIFYPTTAKVAFIATATVTGAAVCFKAFVAP